MKWSRKISVVGAHAEGEVGNVIVGGMPHISGDTMFDKKEYMEQHMDEIRTMILFEPRGCPFHYDAGVPSFSNSLLQIYPFKKSTYYFFIEGSD